tara:strand:+ start:462 stop:710 length:249 start_codon:yes stop_codon:yes gene_type:complete
MDSFISKQFDSKIIDCFHFFTEPSDIVRVNISLNDKHDKVVFETMSRIPLAHTMPLEQFLNTPIDALKIIAKGLCQEIRIVG